MEVEESTVVAKVKDIDSEEPLLQENPRRFVVFPIKHTDIWQFYKKAEGNSDF
jgi:ribonucleoside-diphosphate reductase subunit M2